MADSNFLIGTGGSIKCIRPLEYLVDDPVVIRLESPGGVSTFTENQERSLLALVAYVKAQDEELRLCRLSSYLGGEIVDPSLAKHSLLGRRTTFIGAHA